MGNWLDENVSHGGDAEWRSSHGGSFDVPEGVTFNDSSRWQAAIKAGLTSIPCIQVVYANKLDEQQALVEYNRYRIKSGDQLEKEGVLLEEVEAARAKERQVTTFPEQGQKGFQSNVVQTFAPHDSGKTRDKVASTIGLGSGKQWDKLKAIGKEARGGNETAKHAHHS